MKTKFFYLFIFVLLASSCSKWEIFNKKEQNLVVPQSPTVTTGKAVDGSENYAVISGEITDVANDIVLQYGHCWSSSKALPTIEDAKTSLGSKTTIGTFTSTLTDLIPGASYYVRAYAINKTGVSYGTVFTYVAKPQNYINISAPNATSEWKKGLSYDIKWSENSSDNVKIDLIVAGTVYKTISASAPGTGVFSWSPSSDIAEANYYSIKITSTKNPLVFDETSTFSISNNSQPPTVVTLAATNISQQQAVASGNITVDGGSTVLSRGICYSTSHNPTFDGSKTSEPGTLGSFNSIINGLTPNTLYYYRAYANSRGGTGYGAEMSFKTLDKIIVPTVDQPVQNSVSSTTASMSCNVLTDGGASVTLRGVCWSTSGNPTVSDKTANFGAGTGSFSATLSDLAPNTTFYVRTFAQNSAGVSYSNQITITTAAPTMPQITFVSVTGATFSMGNSSGSTSELPVHSVILKNFNISTTEITNAQYAHFLTEYQSSTVLFGDYTGQTMIYEDPMGLSANGSTWSPRAGFENNPVVGVTWYGAYEFCRFYGIRLPTEAEWEFAARGGVNKDTYRYSGGNILDEVAWYYDNSLGMTNPVGQKKANSLGIYDMNGNAWEWVNDWYDNYLAAAQVNPTGPASGTKKTMRGGSRSSSATELSTTQRSSASPDFKHTTVGFRVAK